MSKVQKNLQKVEQLKSRAKTLAQVERLQKQVQKEQQQTRGIQNAR